MGQEGIDLVSKSTGEKKQSLLQKYDIPVEHLSFEYIKECNNVKEIERIIRILRSGEEGRYPDLEARAESRLEELSPGSSLLQRYEKVVSTNGLGDAQRQELLSDLEGWRNEMKLRELDNDDEKRQDLDSDDDEDPPAGSKIGGRSHVCSPRSALPLPAVRTCKGPILETVDTSIVGRNRVEGSNSSQMSNTPGKKQQQRLSSSDYAAWDKYDVDTELNRLDLQEEREIVQAKRLQEMRKAEKTSIAKETIIEKSLLSATELSYMSGRERDKGNEAFRAGDYDEALQHYTTSIALDADLNAYNNRAIAHIKLKNYEKAVKDCNEVLSADQMNLKALLRRALAYQHLGKNVEALKDYELALQVDPSNKVAISFVSRLRRKNEAKTVRLTIEEITE
ncbi:hypothetical protein QAD02_005915 [Eretmocerus hayati]|uniref:Uncharacterized protein n=1 Tax=Eretmocerus hayati TaxID=131215 RepID=A0ACC2MZQ0_9HYME|nr:hypothetical protein QAD02_005915 [Eretmocerus hayati]